MPPLTHTAPAHSRPGLLAALQILLLSRLTAIALLVVYGSYLVFQLGTHHHLFGGSEEETGTPALTLTAAIAWLSGITVLVAVLSEYLTGSIEEVGGWEGHSLMS